MKAIYAFSGDPITYGHIDIIERAAETYEHVTVGIGANPEKARGYLFSVEERMERAREAVSRLPSVIKYIDLLEAEQERRFRSMSRIFSF